MSLNRKLYLSPSLLSANFANLEADVRMLEKGGADFLHIDVMDGHFVPNITIGPLVVSALKKITNIPLDCHLMISNPDEYLEAFAKAGATYITIHVEAALHLHRSIQQIKQLGCKAGVTLNPATPISAIEEILPYVDMVLLMSVEPGFGGQKFIDNVFNRIKKVRQLLNDCGNSNCLIEIDGGVKIDNIKEVFDCGVDVVVSGSGIFDTENPIQTMQAMMQLCGN